MKKINFIGAILASSLILSGCATARLSQGPDIQSLKSHAGAAQVAVAMVEDGRGATHAGSIGATSIDVPTSVTDMVYHYLIAELNSNFGLNIKEAGKLSQEDVAQAVSSSGADKVVVSKINSIKISSFDAIMQPVQTQIQLDLSVLDRRGQAIYKHSYLGEYEERIGLSMVDSKTGQLVESSVQQLMKEITNDADLKQALVQ